MIGGSWPTRGVDAAIILLLPFFRSALRGLARHARVEFVARPAPCLELFEHFRCVFHRHKGWFYLAQISSRHGKEETEGLTGFEANPAVTAGKLPVHREGVGRPVGFDDSGER